MPKIRKRAVGGIGGISRTGSEARIVTPCSTRRARVWFGRAARNPRLAGFRLLEQAAEVEVGDVGTVDDGGGVDAERDRDHFGDLLAGGAFPLRLLQVSLEATL